MLIFNGSFSSIGTLSTKTLKMKKKPNKIGNSSTMVTVSPFLWSPYYNDRYSSVKVTNTKMQRTTLTQRNFYVTKCQWNGKMCSSYQDSLPRGRSNHRVKIVDNANCSSVEVSSATPAAGTSSGTLTCCIMTVVRS